MLSGQECPGRLYSTVLTHARMLRPGIPDAQGLGRASGGSAVEGGRDKPAPSEPWRGPRLAMPGY